MTLSAPSAHGRDLFGAIAPSLFVVLWSTGFIGAKFGLPYAEPLTFLGLRCVTAAALLGAIALVTGAAWPRSWRALRDVAIAGLLVHAAYLGGVFEAISLGMPAGVVALVVALQPLLTAALAGWMLGEQVRPRQWLGLGLGLAGVALVLSSKLETGSIAWDGILAALVALLGMTLGTLYQKRFGKLMDLRSGTALQFAVSGGLFLLVAPLVEATTIRWTGEFLFALGWLTLVMSVGVIPLFYVLIRRGEAARVASLMYLVPPFTAMVAWPLFGETLGLAAWTGVAIVVVGVALATRS